MSIGASVNSRFPTHTQRSGDDALPRRLDGYAGKGDGFGLFSACSKYVSGDNYFESGINAEKSKITSTLCSQVIDFLDWTGANYTNTPDFCLTAALLPSHPCPFRVAQHPNPSVSQSQIIPPIHMSPNDPHKPSSPSHTVKPCTHAPVAPGSRPASAVHGDITPNPGSSGIVASSPTPQFMY